MILNSDTATYEDLSSTIVEYYLVGAAGKTLTAIRSDDVDDHVIPALNIFADELMLALGEGNRSTIADCRTACGKWPVRF